MSQRRSSPPHGHCGLVGFERDVMALWDEGLGSRAIMTRTGLNHGQVCKVLSQYASDERRNDEQMIIAATMLLGARIIEVHGRMH